MLSVVLFPVVAPAEAVHDPVNGGSGKGTRQDVEDLPFFLEDGDDRDVVQAAEVEGLAAPLGIERRPVQDHGGLAAVVAEPDEPGVEFQEVGVGPVESLGHDVKA